MSKNFDGLSEGNLQYAKKIKKLGAKSNALLLEHNNLPLPTFVPSMKPGKAALAQSPRSPRLRSRSKSRSPRLKSRSPRSRSVRRSRSLGRRNDISPVPSTSVHNMTRSIAPMFGRKQSPKKGGTRRRHKKN